METPIGDIPSLGLPVLLTVVLNLFAEGFKKATNEKTNGWIPLLLMTLGGIIYPLAASVSSVTANVASPMIYNTLVGIAIGGAAVGVNQIVKQATKKTDPKP